MGSRENLAKTFWHECIKKEDYENEVARTVKNDALLLEIIKDSISKTEEEMRKEDVPVPTSTFEIKPYDPIDQQVRRLWQKMLKRSKQAANSRKVSTIYYLDLQKPNLLTLKQISRNNAEKWEEVVNEWNRKKNRR